MSSTFIPKIQKGPYKSELSGAELCAFQAVASKLHGSMGAEQGRQMWGNLTREIHSLSHQLPTVKDQLEAVEKFQTRAINAIHGNVVAAKLAEAGYGEWDKVTVLEGDKERMPQDVQKHAHQLYGAKIKFKPILEKAVTTLKQYIANVKSAIELDVEYLGVPVSKLVQSCKKAREAAQPALVGESLVAVEVNNVGKDLGASYQAATAYYWDEASGKMVPKDRQAVNVFQAFGLIARVWNRLDSDVRDHVAEVLLLTSEIAGEVYAKIEAEAAEADAEKAMAEAPTVEARAVDALRDLNDDNAPVDEREPIAA